MTGRQREGQGPLVAAAGHCRLRGLVRAGAPQGGPPGSRVRDGTAVGYRRVEGSPWCLDASPPRRP